MAEKVGANVKVHAIAGFDFRMVPRGVAMTVRYYIEATSSSDEEVKFRQATQALTVGLNAAQIKDLANSLQRAVQILESNSVQDD